MIFWGGYKKNLGKNGIFINHNLLKIFSKKDSAGLLKGNTQYNWTSKGNTSLISGTSESLSVDLVDNKKISIMGKMLRLKEVETLP